MTKSEAEHSDQERWNRKYRRRGPESFGAVPNDWLADHAELFEGAAGSRALDLACGTGRNARYLARRGFTVDALDVSDVAVEWLRDVVEREGLDVSPRCCDLAVEALLPRAYDVVVNVNFLDRDLFARIRRALRPGGLLVFETFTREHAVLRRRAMSAAFTLEPGELRLAFEDLEILDYREVTLDAGDPNQARAVASLVARAPRS